MQKYVFHFNYIDPIDAMIKYDCKKCHIMTWVGTYSTTRHYHCFSANIDDIKFIGGPANYNKIIQHFTTFDSMPPIYGLKLSFYDLIQIDDDIIFKNIIFNL